MQPLRILIGNRSFIPRGGTEAWVATVAQALRSLGHSVDLVSAEDGPQGLASKRIFYDLALINHNVTVRALADWHIGVRIMTCHGPHRWESRFELPFMGADAYVSVSEMVQDQVASMGYHSIIIRNPIDKVRFCPDPAAVIPNRVVFSCGDKGVPSRHRVLNIVRSACTDLDFQLVADHDHSEIHKEFQKAAVVIGIGRVAQEAIACGCRTVIFDYRGGDGAVNKFNIPAMQKTNFNGTVFGLMFSPEQLRREIDKAKPVDSSFLPTPEEVALQYLDLFQRVRKCQT